MNPLKTVIDLLKVVDFYCFFLSLSLSLFLFHFK